MDEDMNCELCEELDQSEEGPCPECAIEAAQYFMGED
jgi:hypothetical protein